MIIKKETALENINADIKETLNWKLEQLESSNLPVESGLADYIHFGMSNIDAKIEQLKNYKKSIDDEIKLLSAYKLTTSEKIADWVQGQGVDKLNGLECSSITINKGAEAKEELLRKRVFVLDVDNERMEKFLIENSLAHYESIEEIKIIPSSKDKIRINSKRK